MGSAYSLLAVDGDHSLLQVIEAREAGRVRVRLRGELHLATAFIVSDRQRRLRERGEWVLLDLDELEFMDMSGLRMVSVAAADSSRDGLSFAVTAGSSPMRRRISLVRLDRPLPLDGRST